MTGYPKIIRVLKSMNDTKGKRERMLSIRHAWIVIDNNGRVTKDRHGEAGRMATEEELAAAVEITE